MNPTTTTNLPKRIHSLTAAYDEDHAKIAELRNIVAEIEDKCRGRKQEGDELKGELRRMNRDMDVAEAGRVSGEVEAQGEEGKVEGKGKEVE